MIGRCAKTVPTSRISARLFRSAVSTRLDIWRGSELCTCVSQGLLLICCPDVFVEYQLDHTPIAAQAFGKAWRLLNTTEEQSADTVERFFERSEELHIALADCFPDGSIPIPEDEAEVDLCVTACFLSIEHAGVLRGAFASVAPNTGSAILRLQYEALLRGAWVLFAATPDQVSKLARDLDSQAEQAAKNLPGMMDMLAALKERGPPPVVRNLEDFNAHHRHALNSFVHGGIHPLKRSQEGFPLQLALRLVAISNGLMINAFQILAALSDSLDRTESVRNLHGAFPDCLPPLRTPSAV